MESVKRYCISQLGSGMEAMEEGPWVAAADFDRVTAEREALQLMLNDREELLTSLEQRRHAEQQACQAAERRVEDLRDRKNSIVALQATLTKAREWLGDGKYSDGLHREHWTPEYVALVEQIDALLSNKSAPFDIVQLKPVLQWSEDRLCWMDGEENEMVSARCAGYKTRTLYLHPAEQPAPMAVAICKHCGWPHINETESCEDATQRERGKS